MPHISLMKMRMNNHGVMSFVVHIDIVILGVQVSIHLNSKEALDNPVINNPSSSEGLFLEISGLLFELAHLFIESWW